MAGQLTLHKLVDLALCDPEVGAVNFNHLRTLLLSILKLTNHTNSPVVQEDAGINSTINPKVEPLQEASGTSLLSESGRKSSIKDAHHEEHGGIDNNDELMSKTPDIKTLLLNQRNLENRILRVEKNFEIDEAFPPNDEILIDNRKAGEDTNTFKNADDSIELDDYKLRTIWQNKKSIRRLDGAEEGIDKLFSLMNDILTKEKSNVLRDEYEWMKNQILDLQNKLDQYTNDANNQKDNMQSDKLLIEEMSAKVDHLGDIVNENSSNLVKNINKTDDNCRKIEAMEIHTKNYKDDNNISGNMEDQISNLENNMDKFMSMLDEKANLRDLNKNVNTPELELLQSEISRLTEEVGELQEKMSNLANTFDLETVNKIGKELDSYVLKTDGILSEIRKDIEEINRSITNVGDEKLKQMLDKIEGISSMTDTNEEIDAIKGTIRDILIQLEQNKKLQHDIQSKFEGLNSGNEPRFTTQEIDTSVLAALQHLAQENRQQISAIQGNMKMLQKLQMPILPAIPKEESSGGDHENIEMFESLQNHILTLQEEQIKQSANISNMVDDYKEEFNRKQLHIDALYDYIEKLQHDKANREDIFSVEMNIKADKQSLDKKVNMTTFDERYQMLEQALQQTLSRLDQYVEEENTLKGEFSKLSEDLSSKMDSDAGKQLKKFLDERLKAIQVSRTHLPDVRDIRDGAAGLRKPMPLHYNCLSCDRSIDVTMRGIRQSVPYNMPSRNPLASVKPDKKSSLSSYNSMVANRSCGGLHTSVNVNTLRMVKVSPLQNSIDYNVVSKPSSGNELPSTDGVIGKDGQIYRGRHKTQEMPNPKQSQRNSARSITRAIHSANVPNKSNDTPKGVDRSHSVTDVENKDEIENPFYLPLINDMPNGRPPS